MSRTELLQVMTSWDPPIQAGSLFPYQTPLTWLYGSCMWQLARLSECDDMSLWGQLCETRARFARAGFFNLKEIKLGNSDNTRWLILDRSPSWVYLRCQAFPLLLVRDNDARAAASADKTWMWIGGRFPRRGKLQLTYALWTCFADHASYKTGGCRLASTDHGYILSF
jgi:hypothetical protein